MLVLYALDVLYIRIDIMKLTWQEEIPAFTTPSLIEQAPFALPCLLFWIVHVAATTGLQLQQRYTKYMGVSVNGGTPISHPKMIIFIRKTPWLLEKPTILGNIHIIPSNHAMQVATSRP